MDYIEYLREKPMIMTSILSLKLNQSSSINMSGKSIYPTQGDSDSQIFFLIIFPGSSFEWIISQEA